jgi:hypothetical protein
MLAINLATRGRPLLLRNTIERTQANIRRRDTLFFVSVDEDDAETIDALQDYLKKDMGVRVLVRQREDSVGAKFNRIIKEVPDASVYLVMVDYVFHTTRGFDQIILDAADVFPDGIGVIYDNRMANASFPAINAVTRRWVELIGHIYPEMFPYWFIDHWLDDVARLTDRIVCADVAVDVTQQTLRTTQELREPYLWATFFDLCMLERRREAMAVIGAMEDSLWHKQMLISRFPMVEVRSRHINDIVRLNAVNLEMVSAGSEASERYARLRDHAVRMSKKMLPELQRRKVPILQSMGLAA